MTPSLPKPWTSGPKEVLAHGLMLQASDSDSARRIAMILIDSSVELMIKTYLGLPPRVTGLRIPRAQYEDFVDSFPKLLDALEKYAGNRIAAVDLAEIEWYHRLRNQLYHEGNGITVERDKLIVYGEIAKVLFRALFDVDLDIPEPTKNEPLSQFLSTWAQVDKGLLAFAQRWGTSIESTPDPSSGGPQGIVSSSRAKGIVAPDIVSDLQILRELRNRVVHSAPGASEQISVADVRRLKQIAKILERHLSRR